MLSLFELQLQKEKCNAQALLAMSLNQDMLTFMRELAAGKNHCDAILKKFEQRASNIRGRNAK